MKRKLGILSLYILVIGVTLALAGIGVNPAQTVQRFFSSEFVSAQINASSSGDQDLVAASAGDQICVHELVVWNVSSKDFSIKSGAATTLDGPFTSFPSTTGYSLEMTELPHYCTAVGEALVLNLGAATAMTGHVTYRLE